MNLQNISVNKMIVRGYRRLLAKTPFRPRDTYYEFVSSPDVALSGFYSNSSIQKRAKTSRTPSLSVANNENNGAPADILQNCTEAAPSSQLQLSDWSPSVDAVNSNSAHQTPTSNRRRLFTFAKRSAASPNPAQTSAQNSPMAARGAKHNTNNHSTSTIIQIAPSVTKQKQRKQDKKGNSSGAEFSAELLAKYTLEELKEYMEVFRMFDKDNSGAIGTSELEDAMRSLGMNPTPDELETLIKEVDADGNGEVDFDEFCTVLRKITTKKEDIEEIVKSCFEVFDQDKDGCISEMEFRRVLTDIGNFPQEQQDEIFKEFDILGTGKISYEAFAQMVRHYWQEDEGSSPVSQQQTVS